MKILIFKALEQGINQYIHLDPEAENLLQPLIGRIVAIEISGLNITINCLFTANNIQILHTPPHTTDACISAPPLAFINMACSEDPSKSLFSGQVKISGDTEIAQQVSDLFNRLDIDWEEHLSRYTGDTIAHAIGNILRDCFSWCKQTRETVRLNISEYIQEELAYFPPREEVDDFMQDVDKVREDVERIAARVDRLPKEQSA